jgi:hypothetical protein
VPAELTATPQGAVTSTVAVTRLLAVSITETESENKLVKYAKGAACAAGALNAKVRTTRIQRDLTCTRDLHSAALGIALFKSGAKDRD